MDYITPERYAENVDARCSNDFYVDKINTPAFADVLVVVGLAAERLDLFKKCLFYGKEHPETSTDARPNFGLYNGTATPIELSKSQQMLLHAIVGIATEAGELVDALVKGLADAQMNRVNIDDAFDNVNLREEFGDVLWYTQLGLNAINSSLPECMTINDNKLEKRFGPAFSSDRAINRDLDAERKELEA